MNASCFVAVQCYSALLPGSVKAPSALVDYAARLCSYTNLAPKLVLGIGPPLMGVGGHGGGRWAPVFGWIMRA